MMYKLDRRSIKARAKASFKGNYWPSVLVPIIMAAIVGVLALIPVVGSIAGFIMAPVLTAGVAYFFAKNYRGEKAEIGDMFAGFKNFGHVLGGSLWMELFVWLWSMLFVIPGIIKAISYSMTPYILVDQPEVSAREALKLSMRMTKGHKGEIFVMYLSFIGWGILTSLTGGILGIFYTVPYMNTTMAGYYEELKAAYIAQ